MNALDLSDLVANQSRRDKFQDRIQDYFDTYGIKVLSATLGRDRHNNPVWQVLASSRRYGLRHRFVTLEPNAEPHGDLAFQSIVLAFTDRMSK